MVLDDQGGQQITVRTDGKAPTLRAETLMLTLVAVENPESLIEQTEGYEVCRKVVRDGQVLILRGENTYNVLGVIR